MVENKKSNKLIIDEKALADLGLSGETFYVCEYDLWSERYLTRKQEEKLTKEQKEANKRFNKLARVFRNKIVFTLKFKLNALKHLESSWFIEGEKLDLAVAEIEAIKADMKRKGFEDAENRIKLIPIFTTIDGAETYEDQKIQYLLSFISEHIKMAEKGLKEKRIAQSSIWRCKKCVEISNILSEELKGHEQYNELQDEINTLDEIVGEIESFMTEQKEVKAKKAKKDKDD